MNSVDIWPPGKAIAHIVTLMDQVRGNDGDRAVFWVGDDMLLCHENSEYGRFWLYGWNIRDLSFGREGRRGAGEPPCPSPSSLVLTEEVICGLKAYGVEDRRTPKKDVLLEAYLSI